MKKLIIILTILFSFNCKGQDTTYFVKNNVVFMRTTNVSPVMDDTTYQKFLSERKKRRKKDKVLNYVGFAGFIAVNLLVFVKFFK